MTKSRVEIEVTLSEDKIPSKIKWKAEESGISSYKEVKSMFLSLYDAETEETMKLDLWTKEFRIDEMDRFIFQTIQSMADAYYKATSNGDLANHMMQFAQFFGQETGLLTPDSPEDDHRSS